jgi:predicted Zn-dependent protease with MMP-like domain
VERAIDGLPLPLRGLLDEVAIVIDDEPNTEQRRLNRLGPDDVLYGLYEGTPPTEYGADWAPWPNRITLFRLALEEDFPDPDDLVEEVRITLVHELAHHAGFDDDRLADLGMD